MDVFISWSGERSRKAARDLADWLPLVIQAVKPWTSTYIDKGTRWGPEVAEHLANSQIGIICLTPGNLHSDWILFEAGALSKTLDSARVCPLLFDDLKHAQLQGPLAQFQGTLVTKGEILRLLKTINSALGDRSLLDANLDETFEAFWPRLEASLGNLPAEAEAKTPVREPADLLEEILETVRSQARAAVQSSSSWTADVDEILELARALADGWGLEYISAEVEGRSGEVELRILLPSARKLSWPIPREISPARLARHLMDGMKTVQPVPETVA